MRIRNGYSNLLLNFDFSELELCHLLFTQRIYNICQPISECESITKATTTTATLPEKSYSFILGVRSCTR